MGGTVLIRGAELLKHEEKNELRQSAFPSQMSGFWLGEGRWEQRMRTCIRISQRTRIWMEGDQKDDLRRIWI